MSKPEYIPLEELDIYIMAMEIGEMVWEIVLTWEYFQKSTIGQQYVRSADSVAANILEGYGRFHFKDKRNFYYNSRGSLTETKTWTAKSKNRKLITDEQYTLLDKKMKNLHVLLNNHIRSLPI